MISLPHYSESTYFSDIKLAIDDTRHNDDFRYVYYNLVTASAHLTNETEKKQIEYIKTHYIAQDLSLQNFKFYLSYQSKTFNRLEPFIPYFTPEHIQIVQEKFNKFPLYNNNFISHLVEYNNILCLKEILGIYQTKENPKFNEFSSDSSKAINHIYLNAFLQQKHDVLDYIKPLIKTHNITYLINDCLDESTEKSLIFNKKYFDFSYRFINKIIQFWNDNHLKYDKEVLIYSLNYLSTKDELKTLIESWLEDGQIFNKNSVLMCKDIAQHVYDNKKSDNKDTLLNQLEEIYQQSSNSDISTLVSKIKIFNKLSNELSEKEIVFSSRKNKI